MLAGFYSSTHKSVSTYGGKCHGGGDVTPLNGTSNTMPAWMFTTSHNDVEWKETHYRKEKKKRKKILSNSQGNIQSYL